MSVDRGTTVKKKKRWGKIYEYTPTIRASILDEDSSKEIESELKKLLPSLLQQPSSSTSSSSVKIGLLKVRYSIFSQN